MENLHGRTLNQFHNSARRSRLSRSDPYLALGHIGLKGLAPGSIHRRLHILGQRLLPQPGRTLRRIEGAGFRPAQRDSSYLSIKTTFASKLVV